MRVGWARAIGFASIAAVAGAASAQTAAKPVPPAKDAKTIVAAARARVEETDVRAVGRLVEVAASGTRTTNRLVLESHAFPDAVRTLVTVTLPDRTVDRYWVTQDREGHTTIETSRAGAKPERLSSEYWGEAVAGTLFSPEDFADGQFFWARQTLTGIQKYGARECYVLKSEPAAGQASVYRSVTTWIDQKTGAPVLVEAAEKNGITKQFVFYGIERIGGLWLSRQIEAKENGKPGSSLLIVDRGSPHAHLQRKDFDVAVPATAPGNAGSQR